MKKNIAIFASGGGSNAEVIIEHFKDSEKGNIALVVTNKADAYVIERAKNHNIPYFVHTNDDIENGGIEAMMAKFDIDFIVLAGYLKKISSSLVAAFPNKMVNIHPALLPKYGGKGMYGMNVHRAVVAAKEKESGITIHFVNENYDEGNIIEQHQCEIDENMTAEEVQKRVLELEHAFFAPCIESLL